MSQWKIQPDVSLYFVTTTIVDWEFVFTSFPYFDVIIQALKHCIANKGLHLHAYVIMPNHAHYIISAETPEHISHIMRDFNTHTSREITAFLREERKLSVLDLFARAAQLDGRGSDYKVWQEGFHPIALETEDFIMQKLDYLHDNPVRKGYVEEPEHWKYSSARNYALNDHTIILVECLL